MSATKIDFRFSVNTDERGPQGNFETRSVQSAASVACSWKSQGKDPSLWIEWVDADGYPRFHEVPITTTRGTWTALSSAKKAIRAGELEEWS